MPTRSSLICKTQKDTMFSMPKDFRIKNDWIRWMTQHYPNIKLKDNTFLCYKHFESSAFYNYDSWINGKKRGRPTR